MNRQPTIADLILTPLPGWVFLIFGLATVAAALLTPAWLSAQQIQWQKQVMRLQAKQLDKQADKYKQFAQALDDNNPTVLERLAFVELHKQPADKTLLGPQRVNGQAATSTLAPWLAAHRPDGVSTAPLGDAASSSSVDQWLAEPMPLVGVSVPAWQPPDTRIIRLCTGPSRWVVLAAGLFFSLGGLFWTPKT